VRYLTINLVQEGMRIGKDVYNEKGAVLLNKYTVLTKSIIDKLKYLGYKGLLIDDEQSEDLEYQENYVSNEVRISLAKKLNSALTMGSNEKALSKEIENLQTVIANLVDDILSKKELNLNLLELKMFDSYTYFHSVNVAIISLAIAYHLKLSRSDMLIAGTAALLHDIGKLLIGTDLINKPGSFTDDEYEIIKTHCRKGYEILSSGNNLSVKIAEAVLSHHEHYDGTGYPNGLKGEEISLFSRIICIADVYDALTSNRPYRRGCSVLEAIEYIMAYSGTLFDPGLVKIFTSRVYPYPVGASVELSNGETAVVVSNNKEYCLRPKVKIISKEGNRIIDMLIDRDYRSVVINGLVQ